LGSFEGSGFEEVGFYFLLFLGYTKATGAAIEVGGGRRVARAGVEVSSMGSPSPERDPVSSGELPSPRGVSSLTNVVLLEPEEIEKEEEEAMSVPRRSKKCRMNNSGSQKVKWRLVKGQIEVKKAKMNSLSLSNSCLPNSKVNIEPRPLRATCHHLKRGAKTSYPGHVTPFSLQHLM